MSATTTSIWLHLLREGGRWRASEVAIHMDIEDNVARPTLNSMALSKAVVKYRLNGKHVEYGVTDECKVPLGVSIKALRENGIKVSPGARREA